MMWRGPSAAKIVDVEFRDNEIDLTISMAGNLESRNSIVDWESIESQSGSGHLQDYFVN